jgi:hypothetical protein
MVTLVEICGYEIITKAEVRLPRQRTLLTELAVTKPNWKSLSDWDVLEHIDQMVWEGEKTN